MAVFENESKSVYVISHSSNITLLCVIKSLQKYFQKRHKELGSLPGKELFYYFLLYILQCNIM
jgi:hypothetical protein